ncbi:stage II sporulation protein M [Pseudomaricurvus sp. HS19]|uniref:stage II sporulation protein M n=1 Tax=Pseudomaricurvus sp. HS19 TaxID=2692626 RepID=UPI001367C8EA|nr:stage II sporulation protein M [Pseudomaricurvus sp. HS19]MYM62947.1 stage II sporulation protein M [Pseudomaricurvus sp. HS19]
MKQQVFEDQHAEQWRQLEAMLASPEDMLTADFPARYRAVCQHLSVAKGRRYTPYLINYLNRLVVEGHRLLYRHHNNLRRSLLWFLVAGFPSVVRSNRSYVFIAAALFLLPLLVMGIGCYSNSELIYSVADSASVHSYESMYNPESPVLGRERGSGTDVAMFGFYIYNNIGIGFRTFAAGIFFGLGSIFFLVFNGLSIGSIAGYLTQLGYIETFYGFVSGHAAFELTAIVLCGAAGLKLGFSLVAPGPHSRADAIRMAGREAVLIVYGAALMLVVAAFIEAFWSSSRELPLLLKYGVGALMGLLLGAYLLFAGRRVGT